jgi:hypothetical protein
MSVPFYGSGDQHGQPVSRPLPPEYTDHQPALDAWLAEEYWPRRDLVLTLADQLLPAILNGLAMLLPPAVEAQVARGWLLERLTEAPGVTTLQAVDLANRFAADAPFKTWARAVWLLEDVCGGHLDALLADPPPMSVCIQRNEAGVVTHAVYFGQRLVETVTLGGVL